MNEMSKDRSAVAAPAGRSYRESHQLTALEYERAFRERRYRALVWELERHALDRIVPRDSSSALDYLDFACGTGRVLQHLERRVRTAAGVDVSASMLAIAKQKVRRGTLLQADVTRETVFPPQSFDLITAFRFFPRAEPALRSKTLAALRGLLRTSGRLIFNNHLNVGSIRNRCRSLLRRNIDGFEHRHVVRMLAEHGFRIVSAYPIGIWPGSEHVSPALIPWIRSGEWIVAGRRWLLPLANNVIYVCRPDSPRAGGPLARVVLPRLRD